MRFKRQFDKLAAEESRVLGGDFLCPVRKGCGIILRVSGVVMAFDAPRNREGWLVFRHQKNLMVIREGTRREIRQYLDQLPAVRLVLCANQDGQWMGIQASDSSVRVSGLVPIGLLEDAQMFITVVTRFDGKTFWFDEIDGASRRNARTLTKALHDEQESVEAPGLTKAERAAYAIAYLREIEGKRDRNEERIKAAIERAGADYKSYVERGDVFTVEYEVGGEQFKAVVGRDNLDVRSAGICLNGTDAVFDLNSLVSVVKEGQNRELINRVGIRE